MRSEGRPVDGRLIGLQVQSQGSVFDQLGSDFPSRPEAEVFETGLELGGPKRRQAEVVEQVLAQFQVCQLATADQQEKRGERHFHLAESPAEGEGPLGIGIGYHDGTGPPPDGLLGHGGFSTRHRFPHPAAQVQALGQFRGWWVGKDEQRVHGAGGES